MATSLLGDHSNTTTLRELPTLLVEDDIFQMFLNVIVESFRDSSNLSTTTATYGRTEIRSLLGDVLNQLPYDPSGLDAYLTFGKYFNTTKRKYVGRIVFRYFCPVVVLTSLSLFFGSSPSDFDHEKLTKLTKLSTSFFTTNHPSHRHLVVDSDKKINVPWRILRHAWRRPF
jgi:hypothetical protein